MNKANKSSTAVLLSSMVAAASADTNDIPVLEEMLVTGGKENIQTLAGSAHLLDSDVLDQFDFSDLNQTLGLLPGVYIRQEDGFGLRPNIGLRGVTSERSQKITLMEDGVLIKPAPYSAPSAYYIPNIARMSAVEVVKGPASIKQGPNNVGGAINLVTPSVPEDAEGFIDATLGSYGYEKYELFYGETNGSFGYWVNALHFGSDGFKELDSGGDTGFERDDINAKFQWQPEDLMGFEQRFTLKVGHATEESNETYLGQTGADIAENPDRRYAASQLDFFESTHSQVHLDHLLTASDNFNLNTKLYWNSYERSWNKLDGFLDDPFIGRPNAAVPLRDILNATGSSLYQRYIGILRGEINSTTNDSDILDVTNNDRQYGSQGIQFKGDYLLELGQWEHNLEFGVRYHHDYIERDHKTKTYRMIDGIMMSDGVERGSKLRNEANSDALAVFAYDTIDWNKWTFNAGLRYESIEGEIEDLQQNTLKTKKQSYLAPGIGAFWQMSDSLGFLVGANKGFSPAGAGAAEDVNPEEALNYEYGLRFRSGENSAEVIGFFSDYQNLLGRCRASDSGCDVGDEINGGDVEVSGVEVFGEFFLPFGSGNVQFPISFNYTYTESAFQSSFSSSFPQWGDVLEGDELPYLPEHVGRLQLGVQASRWDAYLALNYQGEMRDEASTGDSEFVLFTDAYTTVDFSALWQFHHRWELQGSVDNLLDERAIVSWRPFGARPTKPRTVRLRLKYLL